MAHKKAGGSTQLGRESESKRLGVKIYSGQPAAAGQIIIRQRGTRYIAGEGVKMGGDDTLYAGISGLVHFRRRQKRNFAGVNKTRTIIEISAGTK